MQNFDEIVATVNAANFRVSHLSQSGVKEEAWYAAVIEGKDPRITRGIGRAWGDTPTAALTAALAQGERALASGNRVPPPEKETALEDVLGKLGWEL